MRKALSIFLFLCLMANLICIPVTTSAEVYNDVWEYTVSGAEATITKYTGAETTVTVPSTVSDGSDTYTVTAIGNGSNNVNANLVNVTLPSTIKRIGSDAFKSMVNQNFTINFPEGLEEIGASAFYDTGKKGSLVNIEFPSTLKKIGTRAFYQCTRIKSITFKSETAPTIAVYGSKEAFWNLSGKPVIYYPENGVGYDAVAFRNMFASTNATPVEGTNALTFAYIGTSATAAPSATATPKPTLDPNATPAPTPTATPTPTPVPDSLKVTFSNNKINAKYNYSGDKAVKLLIAQYDNDGIMRQVNMSDDTQLAVDKNELCVTASAFVWTDELEPVFDSESVSLVEEDSLKILLIGNSHSNAREYIVDIAKNLGVKHITVGNLKISASGLSDHWTYASKNRASYNYFKRTEANSSFTTKGSVTMEYGLTDEDWDCVIIQEKAFDNCYPEKYGPYILKLVPYIREKVSNPDVKIGWYMIFAYQQDCGKDVFESVFNNDQMAMYNAIVDGVKNTVLKTEGVDFVVPVGTAIQNARTSLLGDDFTSDGFHLSTHVGCYLAGMTFVAEITGLDVNNVTWVSKASAYPGNYLPAIKESVSNAVKNPLSVTQSTYKE